MSEVETVILGQPQTQFNHLLFVSLKKSVGFANQAHGPGWL